MSGQRRPGRACSPRSSTRWTAIGPPLAGGGSSSGGTVLLDEGLGAGVNDWSWDASVDTSNAEIPAFTGVQSAKVTFSQTWGGFYLNISPLSASSLSSLKLAVNGGASGGQELQVIGFGSGGAVAGSAALPTLSSSWNDVTIPLSSLGLSNGTIEGIAIQGSSGSVEDTFYVDNIRLE